MNTQTRDTKINLVVEFPELKVVTDWMIPQSLNDHEIAIELIEAWNADFADWDPHLRCFIVLISVGADVFPLPR